MMDIGWERFSYIRTYISSFPSKCAREYSQQLWRPDAYAVNCFLKIRYGIIYKFLISEALIVFWIGITHLSTAYCELLLHCYNSNSPIEENIRAICRLAFTVCHPSWFIVAIILTHVDGTVRPIWRGPFHARVYPTGGPPNFEIPPVYRQLYWSHQAEESFTTVRSWHGYIPSL